MQTSLFFTEKRREKFLQQPVISFNESLSTEILNIEDKKRSNIFSWRGQFSPQLIENLLFYYCPRNSTVLDPFSGSGTVLYEAGCLGLEAFGCEINPAAWILSKTYELMSVIPIIKTNKKMLKFPTPHLDKLNACRDNSHLPGADRERVEEAFKKYDQWIKALESIEQGQPDTVEKLVEATNRYKRFIELDLIFDSPDNFLYRQKGQLKLDNSILEEFLPQVIYRSLTGIDSSFEIGPKNTFSGLSFLSSLGNPGRGGEPTLRTKNQDFILGKKLYLTTAFDSQFTNYKLIESHLGYVCAECKTNLDKTMFQEAVATSRD